MPKTVGLDEIEQIFAITDALGVSREALVIPLRPEHPGRVRKIVGGKFEIVVERDGDFGEWLKNLPAQLQALQGR